MTVLTLINTAMTFGILVGVWWGVFQTDAELKETLAGIRKVIANVIDKFDGED